MTDPASHHDPAPVPAGTMRPRGLGCALLALMILAVAGLGYTESHAESRLRKDLRTALGWERGDDGFKPRAYSAREIPPPSAEVLERIRAASPARLQRAIRGHFTELASQQDWHVMDDRSFSRRARALDLVTSLGVVQTVLPSIKEVERRATIAVEFYPPSVASADQAATPTLSAIRDSQYLRHAIGIRDAARAVLSSANATASP